MSVQRLREEALSSPAQGQGRPCGLPDSAVACGVETALRRRPPGSYPSANEIALPCPNRVHPTGEGGSASPILGQPLASLGEPVTNRLALRAGTSRCRRWSPAPELRVPLPGEHSRPQDTPSPRRLNYSSFLLTRASASPTLQENEGSQELRAAGRIQDSDKPIINWSKR